MNNQDSSPDEIYRQDQRKLEKFQNRFDRSLL